MNSLKYIALILSTLVGCGGSLASVSAGHIGCAPSQIEISDEDYGFNTASWTATCGDRVYTCSGVRNQVACTPWGGERSTRAAAASPAPVAEAKNEPPVRQTKWVKQAIEECGIEAEFPSKPKLGSAETKNKRASFTTYTAVAERENEWALALTCARVEALKTTARPKLLDALRDSLLKTVSGELVSEREIIGGREIDFSAAGELARARLLVLDDRVVTATVSPASALNSARLSQFFRSVRVERPNNVADLRHLR
jgi:hypothetical protein